MIHKFYQNGYYIVLDVNSGGVHVVDELTYRLLDYVSEPLTEVCPKEALSALSSEFDPKELLETYDEI